MTQPADQPGRPTPWSPPVQNSSPAPQEIPAGWYPDPEGRAQSRYWDGGEWTDQLGPLLDQPGPAQAAPASAFAPVTTDAQGLPVSDRSRLAAALICFFFGIFGAHRFYVGKVGTGILQLVTAGGLGIWWLVDLIVILVGGFRDARQRLVANW